MSGEVVGWVQRRHERKWTLGQIPLGFVVDVVKDQPVQFQRTKTSDSQIGDLLCSFTIRRKTRRGQSKEQELALAGINPADQTHGPDRIGIAGGHRHRGATWARALPPPPVRHCFARRLAVSRAGGRACGSEHRTTHVILLAGSRPDISGYVYRVGESVGDGW